MRAGSSEFYRTGLEPSLVYPLAAIAGGPETYEEMLDALWGGDYTPVSNVVDRHIHNLRAKRQNDWRQPRFIAMVSGQGYRFIPVLSDDEPTI